MRDQLRQQAMPGPRQLIHLHLQAACPPFHLLGRVGTINRVVVLPRHSPHCSYL